MKKFVKPKLEIAKFNTADIITVSGLLGIIFPDGEDESYKISKKLTDIEWSNQ